MARQHQATLVHPDRAFDDITKVAPDVTARRLTYRSGNAWVPEGQDLADRCSSHLATIAMRWARATATAAGLVCLHR
ncbi:MAG TPA: hypothetical protein VFQ77_10810 [Pseudonocardiaceae bacterium]|nr:hypothetical protein [Pseudonocardiaceae bacterium]